MHRARKLKGRARYTVRYNDRQQLEVVKDQTAKPYWDNYWLAYAAAEMANKGNWKGFHKMLSLAKR
jgi:hypothetical protein